LSLSKVERSPIVTLKALPLMAFLGATSVANAQEKPDEQPVWQAGLAVATVDSSYKGKNRENFVFPVIGYEGKRVYFRGVELGYRFIKKPGQEFAAFSAVAGKRFEPKKQTDPALQQLDERDFRVETGLKFTQHTPYGRFSAESSVNIRDLDTGYKTSLGYYYSLSPNPRQWQVGPRIDVSYVSGSYTDYFYGISEAESLRSGFNEYQSNSSWNLALSLEGYFRINERWTLAGTIKRSFLDDSIRNSPITEGKHANSAFIIVSYRL